MNMIFFIRFILFLSAFPIITMLLAGMYYTPQFTPVFDPTHPGMVQSATWAEWVDARVEWAEFNKWGIFRTVLFEPEPPLPMPALMHEFNGRTLAKLSNGVPLNEMQFLYNFLWEYPCGEEVRENFHTTTKFFMNQLKKRAVGQFMRSYARTNNTVQFIVINYHTFSSRCFVDENSIMLKGMYTCKVDTSRTPECCVMDNRFNTSDINIVWP